MLFVKPETNKVPMLPLEEPGRFEECDNSTQYTLNISITWCAYVNSERYTPVRIDR